MEFWVSLILVEVIPIFMWIVGGICESKSTEFKKAKLGYRSKFSGKNKYTWEYRF